MSKPKNPGAAVDRTRPIDRQKAHEIQAFGHVTRLAIALSENVAGQSVENLNQVLADTITLRDLYKKHRWQVAGPTFYQLHLLFDKHYEEQNELVDTIAERIQSLGGIRLAMAADVAEATIIISLTPSGARTTARPREVAAASRQRRGANGGTMHDR